MSDNALMVRHIRANAALVVLIISEQLGAEIGYDQAGVRWLDGYIQRQHTQGNPANHESLVNTYGAYLGECIRQQFGGEWCEADGAWCIRFDDHHAAYPFARMTEHLEHGKVDSVLQYFTLIPMMLKHSCITRIATEPPSSHTADTWSILT